MNSQHLTLNWWELDKMITSLLILTYWGCCWLLGWAGWRRKMELNISSLILHLNSHSKPKHLLHFFMTKSRRHETSIFKIKRAADWILQINDDFIYLKTKQFLLARFPEAPQPQPRLAGGVLVRRRRGHNWVLRCVVLLRRPRPGLHPASGSEVRLQTGHRVIRMNLASLQ